MTAVIYYSSTKPDNTEEQEYTISALVGEGGTITPSGSSKVKEGGALSYIIAAADGYQIADVRVDGVSVGAVTAYTFENVAADHRIEAYFQKIAASGGNNESSENGGTENQAPKEPEAAGNTTPVKVTQIKITAPSKEIAAGKKVTLTAEVFPEDAANTAVTWKSSNSKYAAVSAKGVVTAKKAGAGKTVTITAEAKDGSGVKAVCKLKIMKHAVTGVKITAKTRTVKAGKSIKLNAAVKTTGGKANCKLEWTSSNPKCASVNSKGKVTGKKKGTVTITVKATDGSGKKASVRIKVVK